MQGESEESRRTGGEVTALLGQNTKQKKEHCTACYPKKSKVREAEVGLDTVHLSSGFC